MKQQKLVLFLFACITANTLGFASISSSHDERTLAKLQGSTTSRKMQQQPTTENKSVAKTKSKQPWDVLRFVRQSSKFVSLPFLPSNVSSNTIRPGQVLWRPSASSTTTTTTQASLFQFAPLDDVVMGGASASTVDNVSGLWRGTVSTSNGGGFVGIRSTPPTLKLDLSSCKGVEWTFQTPATTTTTTRNMPQRVKVVFRDSSDFNGIAWTASVAVPTAGPGKQVKIRVPFQGLTPSIFARIVKDAKEEGIDKSTITALQLVYSKFEFEGKLNPKFVEGEFGLQLLEVKAY